MANPDMIIGINMSVFDGDSSEEYNGYDTGFVVCESLSLWEMPDVTSNINHTLTYGANCTVIEENGSWYNIVYRDEEGKRYSGWVRKEYVLINSNYLTPKASFIIGGSGVDSLYFITVSEDDQIVMSGLTQSSDGTLGSRTKDGPCGWVTCINNNGNVLWNFCRHTAKYEFMEAPAFLPDGRITVIYRTEQNGIGKLELITLSCDGEMLSIRPLLEAGNKMIHFTVYDFDPENGYVIIEMNKKTGTDRWMLYSQEGEYICDITPYDRVENDNVAVMKDGTRISLKSIEQNNGDMLVTFEEPNVEPAGVSVR